jgi:hypothetical protein
MNLSLEKFFALYIKTDRALRFRNFQDSNEKRLKGLTSLPTTTPTIQASYKKGKGNARLYLYRKGMEILTLGDEDQIDKGYYGIIEFEGVSRSDINLIRRAIPGSELDL